jgi:hypothetical protein
MARILRVSIRVPYLSKMKTTLKNTSICIEKLLFNQPGKINI